MKYLAWCIAVVVLLAGITGVVAPDRLLSLRGLAATQAGLLAVSVARVAIGVVLIMTAPHSRAPKMLQIAGAAVLLAGLATPLFGVERTRAVLDWEAAQGATLIRVGSVIVVAIGGLLAMALTPRRGHV
jgi:hypothetical protein